MLIYHFCAERHVKKIRREGIRIGCVYVPKDGDAKSIEIYDGYQWLTLDPVRENQSWATRKLVKYDRTAFRFTVDIPNDQLDRLMDRDQLDKKLPGSGELFDGWKGSENWRVYHGWILPEWIVACDRVDKEDTK